jgi:hypothetical protein
MRMAVYPCFTMPAQDYLCQQLLGWDTAGRTHDAAFDATKSMRLYHLYHHLQQDPAALQRAQVQAC